MNIITTLQTRVTYFCHTGRPVFLRDLATASQQGLCTVTCEVLRGRTLGSFFHRQFTCRQGIKTLATNHSWIFNGFVCVCVCVNVWTAASTALAAGGYLSTGLNATCDWGCILTGLCKHSGRVCAQCTDKDGYTWFRAVHAHNRRSFTIRSIHVMHVYITVNHNYLIDFKRQY